MSRIISTVLLAISVLFLASANAAVLDISRSVYCIQKTSDNTSDTQDLFVDFVLLSENVYALTGRTDFLPRDLHAGCAGKDGLGWVIYFAPAYHHEIAKILKVLNLKMVPLVTGAAAFDIRKVQATARKANAAIVRDAIEASRFKMQSQDAGELLGRFASFVDGLSDRNEDFWLSLADPKDWMPESLLRNIDEEFELIREMMRVQFATFWKQNEALERLETKTSNPLEVVEDYLGPLFAKINSSYALAPEVVDLISLRILERIEQLEDRVDENGKRVVPEGLLVEVINRAVVQWQPERMLEQRLAYEQPAGGAYQSLLERLSSYEGLEPYVYLVLKGSLAYANQTHRKYEATRAPGKKEIAELQKVGPRLAYEKLVFARATHLFPSLYGSRVNINGGAWAVAEGLQFIRTWMLAHNVAVPEWKKTERRIGDVHEEIAIERARRAQAAEQAQISAGDEADACDPMLTKFFKRDK